MGWCVFHRKTKIACYRDEQDARTYVLLDGRKDLHVTKSHVKSHEGLNDLRRKFQRQRARKRKKKAR